MKLTTVQRLTLLMACITLVFAYVTAARGGANAWTFVAVVVAVAVGLSTLARRPS